MREMDLHRAVNPRRSPIMSASDAARDAAHGTIRDLIVERVASRARALRLSVRLQVSTVIDTTGWLRGGVEVHYQRSRARTIDPIMVRVGRDTADSDLLAGGGIVGRCRRYNEAIGRLRQLRYQLATMVRERRTTLVDGTEIASTHAELNQLDALVAGRQALHMGNRVVRLDVLVTETEFFESRVAMLTPIILAAERSAAATWDGDTQKVVFAAELSNIGSIDE